MEAVLELKLTLYLEAQVVAVVHLMVLTPAVVLGLLDKGVLEETLIMVMVVLEAVVQMPQVKTNQGLTQVVLVALERHG